MENWYPEKLMVGNEGTPATYEFMQTVYQKSQLFRYAEFGIYKGGTALNIAKLFPNSELHLFDFENTLNNFKEDIPATINNRFMFYGNSQKFNDSYNWALMKLIHINQNKPVFDYCFLDGAHTVAIDALNFLLVDKLLNVGGYVDFDDYSWTLRGSSLDPIKTPAVDLQYTDEQIDTPQVKMIIDTLVTPDKRYIEVVPNKIYQKIAP